MGSVRQDVQSQRSSLNSGRSLPTRGREAELQRGAVDSTNAGRQQQQQQHGERRAPSDQEQQPPPEDEQEDHSHGASLQRRPPLSAETLELLLRSRRDNPAADPHVRLGRRDYQFYQHAVDAKLSRSSLSTLLALEHRNTTGSTLPLSMRSMDDVDRVTRAVLDEKGLRLRLHQLTAASGDTHEAYMVSIEPLVRTIYEDPLFAGQLDFEIRLEPAGVGAGSGDRIFGTNIVTCDFYQKACSKAPSGALVFTFDIFMDGTVRVGSGAKYFPIMLLVNHLPLRLECMWLASRRESRETERRVSTCVRERERVERDRETGSEVGDTHRFHYPTNVAHPAPPGRARAPITQVPTAVCPVTRAAQGEATIGEHLHHRLRAAALTGQAENRREARRDVAGRAQAMDAS